jgi:hypothetical protein
MPKRARRAEVLPPEFVSIARRLKAGRYPLLTVFPGLDRSPAFAHYPCGAAARRALAATTRVEIVPRKGEWMYVAPHRVPKDAPRQWRPIAARGNVIAAGQQHLRTSPALVLYLDILHELYHVVQRSDGRELWDERYSYVERPTEIEAYRFVVNEARRLGADDAFLRTYLEVMWVPPKEHLRLLQNVGVSTPPRRRRA